MLKIQKKQIIFLLVLINILVVRAGCTDTDGGKNPDERGIMTLTNPQQTRDFEDYCVDSGVYEYWCDDESPGYSFNSKIIECYTGCQDGTCIEDIEICTDTDDGKSYYKKGITSYKDDIGFDKCQDQETLEEFYCEGNSVNSKTYNCPQGCEGGVCKKKITGKHLLVADNKAPSSDVIILTEVGLFLKQNNYDVESTKLNSEVTKDMLDYIVTTFVYEGDVVIVVGSNSPNEHNTLAQEIKDFLEDEKNIKAKIKSSSKVKSDDLRELFPEYIPETEVEELEEETLIPLPTLPEEQDECILKTACNDNNACTTDTCSGTPKKCLNIETMSGCNYNKNCIPIGIRVFNEYCEIDKEVYVQKDKEEPCKNNYECSSNLCINDKCVSPSLIQKIMNWFKGIVGQAIGIFY